MAGPQKGLDTIISFEAVGFWRVVFSLSVYGARLMRELGLQGVVRGKPVRTTISAKSAPCQLNHVNRQFHARAQKALGLQFSLCGNLGWICPCGPRGRRLRLIHSGQAGQPHRPCQLRLDSLEQAIHTRHPVHRSGLVHRSTAGRNTSVPGTPGALPKTGSNRQWAVLGTVITMPWPRASTLSTRPTLSTGAGLRETSSPSSSPPSNSLTGSINGARWSP